MKEQQRWTRGHISRYWSANDFKNLEYTKQSITQEEIDTWKSQGYDHVKSFSGSMYGSNNPMPDWLYRMDNFFPNQKNLTFTFYKMSTLEIMPVHVDHFNTYKKLFNAKKENIRRILVMLEDWKPGHYLEIDGHGITSWVAGDWFMWEADVPHAASNIGIDDRYTLQITCQQMHSDDIWKNLHWFNMPNMKTKKESGDPALVRILHSINHNSYKPVFIYMYNEKIKELETIKHDANEVSILNRSGVDIYLYEPLCSYIVGCKKEYVPGGTKHSQWFYSEFTGKEKATSMRADELDSIVKYAENNAISKDKIRVHTCDYDADKHYPHYNYCMTLLADDIFVKTAIPISPDNTEPVADFDKKFICLNWRYTPHRHFMATYVSTLDSTICSWFYRADPALICNTPWTNALFWEEDHPEYFKRFLSGMEFLNRYAPVNVDLKINDPVNIVDPYFMQHFPNGVIYDTNGSKIDDGKNNSLEPFYRSIFCDIVTESRFAQPTGNYSEKVFHPMFYHKPFVMVAPPKTLEFLKRDGFKTFSEFWDESYDDEYDHEKRLFKIYEIVDFINNKSIDELREMYERMIPILKHNFEVVNKTITPLLADQSWKK